MRLSEQQIVNLTKLVNAYVQTNYFYWQEFEKDDFREWYYILFLEKFGKSARCWDIAIKKVYNEIKVKYGSI